MDFKLPIDNEEEGNENEEMFPIMQGFFLSPRGPIRFNNEELHRILSTKTNEPICTLFNGEYALYLLNKIDGDIERLLFECVKNPSCNSNPKHDLYDVYNYFNTSHFLNFLIAKHFGMNAWAYEGINLQMQIVNSDKGSYSKLMIMIETSECDKFILDYASADLCRESFSEYINEIPGVPISARIIKSKSYYVPVISYGITLGFNSKSSITFDNINLQNFYNRILAKYIGEAINTFYCGYSEVAINSLMALGEKLIRIKFDVVYNGRLIDINFVCTPAVYVNKSTGLAHKYDFSPLGHLISVKPLDDISGITGQELLDFNHMICSTKHSQLLTMGTHKIGVINHFCEDYHVIESSDILCTQHRLLLHDDRRFPSGEDCVFSMIDKKISNFSEVNSFWKPIENIKVTDTANANLIVIGFINFITDKIAGKTLIDILTKINDDLVKIFNIHSNDILSGHIHVMTCYDSIEECRIMIYQLIENKKSESNHQDYTVPVKQAKKKLRIFGGDKK